jgi:hypothetical protein
MNPISKITIKGETREIFCPSSERTNILHNWDFRNPVNQRGQTIYPSGGYTIDRWVHSSGVAGRFTLSVMDKFIRITTTGSVTETNPGIFQFLESPETFAGKTLTYSIMYRTPVGYRGNFNISVGFGEAGTGDSVHYNLPASENWTIASFTVDLTEEQGLRNCYVGDSSIRLGMPSQIGDYIDIAAVKLEIGAASTLANNPPMDFGRELAVCRRYQVIYRGNSVRFRATSIPEGGQMHFAIPLTTPMRITPTIIGTPIIRPLSVPTGITIPAVLSVWTSQDADFVRVGAIANPNSDSLLEFPDGAGFDANL